MMVKEQEQQDSLCAARRRYSSLSAAIFALRVLASGEQRRITYLVAS
jgi:hypothetical protein